MAERQEGAEHKMKRWEWVREEKVDVEEWIKGQ